jgi:hypothetical protein
MLEEYTTEGQRPAVRFLWTNGLNIKCIKKEMFPIYGGKCLSRPFGPLKYHFGGKRFADDEEFETELRKCPRQQSQDFYAEDFFQRSNITFVAHLLTLPRVCIQLLEWEVCLSSCGLGFDTWLSCYPVLSENVGRHMAFLFPHIISITAFEIIHYFRILWQRRAE